MDFTNIRLLSLMKAKMAYASEKQDLISQNIANADTPGYKARKLKDVDFEKLAMIESHRLKMMSTSASHQSGGANRTSYRDQKQKHTYETTPVKNNVALEEQMAQLSYNQMDYTMVTDLYKKTTGLFKLAIGKN